MQKEDAMTHYERARSTGEPTTAAEIAEAAAVRPRLGFLLGLVFLTLTLSTNAARGTDLARYSSWLKSLGPHYEVVQGNVFLMTNDKCPTFVSIFDSCFAQNPASPYIIPQPPIEDSYVDPIMQPPLIPRDLTVKRRTSSIDLAIRMPWSRLFLILPKPLI
jgi:hypothetical protein